MKEGYPFKQAVAIAYNMEKKKKGRNGLTTEEDAPLTQGPVRSQSLSAPVATGDPEQDVSYKIDPVMDIYDDKLDVTNQDILNYLASKGVEVKKEMATTRIVPGSQRKNVGFEFADAPGEESDNLLGVLQSSAAMSQGLDKEGQGFRMHPIMIAASAIGDEDVRMEENIHSIQPALRTLIKGINPLKRKLKRMLLKQDFTFKGKGSDEFEKLSDEEKSEFYKDRLIKDNYALKQGKEFEAKLISDKIQMINQGIIDPSGEVAEDDLKKISIWYSQQKPNAAWLNPLFKNPFDTPEYTETLLKALNKV